MEQWQGEYPRFDSWIESMRSIRDFWPAGQIDMDPKWGSSLEIGGVEPIHIPGLNRGARSVGGIRYLAKGLVFSNDFNGSDVVHGEGITTDFDRIAWYSTFRNGPNWGIYIRKAGIAGLGIDLAEGDVHLLEEATRFAFTKVLLHEYAHFLFDVATLIIEEMVGRPMRARYRHEVTSSKPSWDPIEEGLCNAFAIRQASAAPEILKILKPRLIKHLQHAPEGYRDFEQYAGPKRFTTGVSELFGKISSDSGVSFETVKAFILAFDDRSKVVSPADVPVYLVSDLDDPRTYFSLVTALSTIHQTERFTKQWEKAPQDVQKSWLKRKPALEADVASAGGHFESLKGNLKNEYSVRLAGGFRVKFEHQRETGEWWAIELGPHDSVYS